MEESPSCSPWEDELEMLACEVSACCAPESDVICGHVERWSSEELLSSCDLLLRTAVPSVTRLSREKIPFGISEEDNDPQERLERISPERRAENKYENVVDGNDLTDETIYSSFGYHAINFKNTDISISSSSSSFNSCESGFDTGFAKNGEDSSPPSRFHSCQSLLSLPSEERLERDCRVVTTNTLSIAPASHAHWQWEHSERDCAGEKTVADSKSRLEVNRDDSRSLHGPSSKEATGDGLSMMHQLNYNLICEEINEDPSVGLSLDCLSTLRKENTENSLQTGTSETLFNEIESLPSPIPTSCSEGDLTSEGRAISPLPSVVCPTVAVSAKRLPETRQVSRVPHEDVAQNNDAFPAAVLRARDCVCEARKEGQVVTDVFSNVSCDFSPRLYRGTPTQECNSAITEDSKWDKCDEFNVRGNCPTEGKLGKSGHVFSSEGNLIENASMSRLKDDELQCSTQNSVNMKSRFKHSPPEPNVIYSSMESTCSDSILRCPLETPLEPSARELYIADENEQTSEGFSENIFDQSDLYHASPVLITEECSQESSTSTENSRLSPHRSEEGQFQGISSTDEPYTHSDNGACDLVPALTTLGTCDLVPTLTTPRTCDLVPTLTTLESSSNAAKSLPSSSLVTEDKICNDIVVFIGNGDECQRSETVGSESGTVVSDSVGSIEETYIPLCRVEELIGEVVLSVGALVSDLPLFTSHDDRLSLERVNKTDLIFRVVGSTENWELDVNSDGCFIVSFSDKMTSFRGWQKDESRATALNGKLYGFAVVPIANSKVRSIVPLFASETLSDSAKDITASSPTSSITFRAKRPPEIVIGGHRNSAACDVQMYRAHETTFLPTDEKESCIKNNIENVETPVKVREVRLRFEDQENAAKIHNLPSHSLKPPPLVLRSKSEAKIKPSTSLLEGSLTPERSNSLNGSARGSTTNLSNFKGMTSPLEDEASDVTKAAAFISSVVQQSLCPEKLNARITSLKEMQSEDDSAPAKSEAFCAPSSSPPTAKTLKSDKRRSSKTKAEKEDVSSSDLPSVPSLKNAIAVNTIVSHLNAAKTNPSSKTKFKLDSRNDDDYSYNSNPHDGFLNPQNSDSSHSDALVANPTNPTEASSLNYTEPPVTSPWLTPQESLVNPTDASKLNPTETPSLNSTDASQLNPIDASRVNPTDALHLNPTDALQLNPIDVSQLNPTDALQLNPIGVLQLNSTDALQLNPIDVSQLNPTDALELNPIGVLQLNSTDITQLNPTDTLQSNPTGVSQLNPTSTLQLNPTDVSQLNSTDTLESNPTGVSQLNPTSTLQLNPTDVFQLNRTDALHLNRTDAFQLNPTDVSLLNPTEAPSLIVTEASISLSANESSILNPAEAHSIPVPAVTLPSAEVSANSPPCSSSSPPSCPHLPYSPQSHRSAVSLLTSHISTLIKPEITVASTSTAVSSQPLNSSGVTESPIKGNPSPLTSPASGEPHMFSISLVNPTTFAPSTPTTQAQLNSPPCGSQTTVCTSVSRTHRSDSTISTNRAPLMKSQVRSHSFPSEQVPVRFMSSSKESSTHREADVGPTTGYSASTTTTTNPSPTSPTSPSIDEENRTEPHPEGDLQRKSVSFYRGMAVKNKAMDITKQLGDCPSRHKYSTKFPMDIICQGRLFESRRKTAPYCDFSEVSLDEPTELRQRLSSVGQKRAYPTSRSFSTGRMELGRRRVPLADFLASQDSEKDDENKVEPGGETETPCLETVPVADVKQVKPKEKTDKLRESLSTGLSDKFRKEHFNYDLEKAKAVATVRAQLPKLRTSHSFNVKLKEMKGTTFNKKDPPVPSPSVIPPLNATAIASSDVLKNETSVKTPKQFTLNKSPSEDDFECSGKLQNMADNSTTSPVSNVSSYNPSMNKKQEQEEDRDQYGRRAYLPLPKDRAEKESAYCSLPLGRIPTPVKEESSCEELSKESEGKMTDDGEGKEFSTSSQYVGDAIQVPTTTVAELVVGKLHLMPESNPCGGNVVNIENLVLSKEVSTDSGGEDVGNKKPLPDAEPLTKIELPSTDSSRSVRNFSDSSSYTKTEVFNDLPDLRSPPADDSGKCDDPDAGKFGITLPELPGEGGTKIPSGENEIPASAAGIVLLSVAVEELDFIDDVSSPVEEVKEPPQQEKVPERLSELAKKNSPRTTAFENIPVCLPSLVDSHPSPHSYPSPHSRSSSSPHPPVAATTTASTTTTTFTATTAFTTSTRMTSVVSAVASKITEGPPVDPRQPALSMKEHSDDFSSTKEGNLKSDVCVERKRGPRQMVKSLSPRSEDESLSSVDRLGVDGDLASASASSTGSALSWGSPVGPVARRDLLPLEDEEERPTWQAFMAVNPPDSDDGERSARYESDDDFDSMDAEMRRLEEKLRKFEKELGISSGEDVLTSAAKSTGADATNEKRQKQDVAVPRVRQEDIDVLQSFSLPDVYPPVDIRKTRHISLIKDIDSLLAGDDSDGDSSSLETSSSVALAKPAKKLKPGEKRVRSLDLQSLMNKRRSKFSITLPATSSRKSEEEDVNDVLDKASRHTEHSHHDSFHEFLSDDVVEDWRYPTGSAPPEEESDRFHNFSGMKESHFGYLWREDDSDMTALDFDALEDFNHPTERHDSLFFIFEDDDNDEEGYGLFFEDQDLSFAPTKEEFDSFHSGEGERRPSDEDPERKKRDISLVSAFKNSFRKAAKYLGPNPFGKQKDEDDDGLPIRDPIPGMTHRHTVYSETKRTKGESKNSGKYNVRTARVHSDESDMGDISYSSGEFHASPAVCVVTSDEERHYTRDKRHFIPPVIELPPEEIYANLTLEALESTQLGCWFDTSIKTPEVKKTSTKTPVSSTTTKPDDHPEELPPPVPPRRSQFVLPPVEKESESRRASLTTPKRRDSETMPLEKEPPPPFVPPRSSSSHKPTSVKQLKRKQQERRAEDAREASGCACVGVPVTRGRPDQPGNHNRLPSPHPRVLPERRTWPPRARSEEQVATNQTLLDAESVWLVHRGGFCAGRLLEEGNEGGDSALPEGRVRVQLEHSNDVIEVDEDDVEKANPTTFDRCEDLSHLRYLNESSILHTLRQRYGSNLIHTYAGAAMVVINPTTPLAIYSEKVIQMFKGCKLEDMPPHIYSVGQATYRDLINTRRDQSIVFLGRSGAGKTTNFRHVLHYLALAAGASNKILTVEKLNAISTLLEAFGNSRTVLNTNATRFTQMFSLDFDHSGQIASASVQVYMPEKMRVVRRPQGEPNYHIFYQLLSGADDDLKTFLGLDNLTDTNLFMTPLQRNEDKQRAGIAWARIRAALDVLKVSEDEQKAIWSVLASIYHIGTANAVKVGNSNKYQFANPTHAQKAANLLGTSVEELARSIFTSTPSSSAARNSYRPGSSSPTERGFDRPEGLEAIEGIAAGLYAETFNAIVALINRCISTSAHTANSILVVDSPGFQNPASCGRGSGATFSDLCHNYAQERLQMLFHDATFTAQTDRYAQEHIECGDVTDELGTPAPLISLLDKPSSNSVVRTSQVDLREADRRGLLWLLDEEAIFPGASDQSFIQRLFTHYGDREFSNLINKGTKPEQFILHHFQGTNPVSYTTQGWLKASRENPVTRQAAALLQESNREILSRLFVFSRGPVSNTISGSVVGIEGSQSLRRASSIRRAFTMGTASFKRKSVCLQVKFTVDGIIETLRRTKLKFVHCVLPQHNAGLCDLKGSPQTPNKTSFEDVLLNVPLVRSQIRGCQILDALRLHKQGFPEHLQYPEFRRRFSVLAPSEARMQPPIKSEKVAAEAILPHLDLDASSYRLGLSQIFFRTGIISRLEEQRDLVLTDTIVRLQAVCRGVLARRKLQKRKVQETAIRCIQKNVRKFMAVRDWPWWRLLVRVTPLLNVHRTEEELRSTKDELDTLKVRLEKAEKERQDLKHDNEKLEARYDARLLKALPGASPAMRKEEEFLLRKERGTSVPFGPLGNLPNSHRSPPGTGHTIEGSVGTSATRRYPFSSSRSPPDVHRSANGESPTGGRDLDPVVLNAGFTFRLKDPRATTVHNHVFVNPASEVPHTESSSLTRQIDKFLKKSDHSLDRFQKLLRRRTPPPKPPRSTPSTSGVSSSSPQDMSRSPSVSGAQKSPPTTTTTTFAAQAERHRRILAKVVSRGRALRRNARLRQGTSSSTSSSSSSSSSGDEDFESDTEDPPRHDRSDDTSAEISKLSGMEYREGNTRSSSVQPIPMREFIYYENGRCVLPLVELDDLSSGSEDEFFDVQPLPGFCIPGRPQINSPGIQGPIVAGTLLGTARSGRTPAHSNSLPAINKIPPTTKMGNAQPMTPDTPHNPKRPKPSSPPRNPQQEGTTNLPGGIKTSSSKTSLVHNKKYPAPQPPISREPSFKSAVSGSARSSLDESVLNMSIDSSSLNEDAASLTFKRPHRNPSFKKYRAPPPPPTQSTTDAAVNGTVEGLHDLEEGKKEDTQNTLSTSSPVAQGVNPKNKDIDSVSSEASQKRGNPEGPDKSRSQNLSMTKASSPEKLPNGPLKQDGTMKTANSKHSVPEIKEEIESEALPAMNGDVKITAESPTTKHSSTDPVDTSKGLEGDTKTMIKKSENGNDSIKVIPSEQQNKELQTSVAKENKSDNVDKETDNPGHKPNSNGPNKDAQNESKVIEGAAASLLIEKKRKISSSSLKTNTSSKDSGDDRSSKGSSGPSSRVATPEPGQKKVYKRTVSGKLASLTNMFEKEDKSSTKETAKINPKTKPAPRVGKLTGLANKFEKNKTEPDRRASLNNPYSKSFSIESSVIDRNNRKMSIGGIDITKFGSFVKPTDVLNVQKVKKDTDGQNDNIHPENSEEETVKPSNVDILSSPIEEESAANVSVAKPDSKIKEITSKQETTTDNDESPHSQLTPVTSVDSSSSKQEITKDNEESLHSHSTPVTSVDTSSSTKSENTSAATPNTISPKTNENIPSAISPDLTSFKKNEEPASSISSDITATKNTENISSAVSPDLTSSKKNEEPASSVSSDITATKNISSAVSPDLTSSKKNEELASGVASDITTTKNTENISSAVSPDYLTSSKKNEELASGVASDITTTKNTENISSAVSPDLTSSKKNEEPVSGVSSDITSTKNTENIPSAVSPDLTPSKKNEEPASSVSSDITPTKKSENIYNGVSSDVISSKVADELPSGISPDITFSKKNEDVSANSQSVVKDSTHSVDQASVSIQDTSEVSKSLDNSLEVSCSNKSTQESILASSTEVKTKISDNGTAGTTTIQEPSIVVENKLTEKSTPVNKTTCETSVCEIKASDCPVTGSNSPSESKIPDSNTTIDLSQVSHNHTTLEPSLYKVNDSLNVSEKVPTMDAADLFTKVLSSSPLSTTKDTCDTSEVKNVAIPSTEENATKENKKVDDPSVLVVCADRSRDRLSETSNETTVTTPDTEVFEDALEAVLTIDLSSHKRNSVTENNDSPVINSKLDPNNSTNFPLIDHLATTETPKSSLAEVDKLDNNKTPSSPLASLLEKVAHDLTVKPSDSTSQVTLPLTSENLIVDTIPNKLLNGPSEPSSLVTLSTEFTEATSPIEKYQPITTQAPDKTDTISQKDSVLIPNTSSPVESPSLSLSAHSSSLSRPEIVVSNLELQQKQTPETAERAFETAETSRFSNVISTSPILSRLSKADSPKVSLASSVDTTLPVLTHSGSSCTQDQTQTILQKVSGLLGTLGLKDTSSYTRSSAEPKTDPLSGLSQYSRSLRANSVEKTSSVAACQPSNPTSAVLRRRHETSPYALTPLRPSSLDVSSPLRSHSMAELASHQGKEKRASFSTEGQTQLSVRPKTRRRSYETSIPKEVLNISEILRDAEDRLSKALSKNVSPKPVGERYIDAYDPSQFDILMPLPDESDINIIDKHSRSSTPFTERSDRSPTPKRVFEQTEAMLTETDRILRKTKSQSSLRRSYTRSLSGVNIHKLTEVTADLSEEHSTAQLASERIEAEQSERMRLEKEVAQLQVDVKRMTTTNDKLEMEKLRLKNEVLQHAELNGDIDDETADASLYKRKYEWCLREIEVLKKQLKQQQEDDLDQLLTLKKQLEKKVTDAYEETDEQRQVVAQMKKKSQRLQAEMNDMKILLEEQTSRNNLLEKKQRKFDQEMQSVVEDQRNERLAKEKIQREKDQILSEKYSFEQEVATLKLELELKEEKLCSVNRELEDLNFTGKAEEEVAILKKAKHDLELRVKDQEEELDDLAGQVQMLEGAKIRLEMSIEQTRKENRKEISQRDEEVEEVRMSAQKKIKGLEGQLENEHEERSLLVREKHELERRLMEAHNRSFATVDEESFHRVRKELKKTKALLKDTQTMLEKTQSEGSNKLLLRQLKTQLEDCEFAKAAAIKAKQSTETDFTEIQNQLEEAQRARKDVEDKLARVNKEKTEMQTQLEESEEEVSEVMKKYKASVSQLSVDQINISEQAQLIADLEHDKQVLQDKLSELSSKVEVLEGETANIHTQRRLQMKIKELESKLDLESTTRQRLESQIARLKDQVDRVCAECDALRFKESQAVDYGKKLNRQLREAKEDCGNLQAKLTDSVSRKQEVEKQFELAESEIITLKSDLKLAFKRIEDLQQALQGEISDSDSEISDSGSESDASLSSFLTGTSRASNITYRTTSPDSKGDHFLEPSVNELMAVIKEDSEEDYRESFA